MTSLNVVGTATGVCLSRCERGGMAVGGGGSGDDDDDDDDDDDVETWNHNMWSFA